MRKSLFSLVGCILAVSLFTVSCKKAEIQKYYVSNNQISNLPSTMPRASSNKVDLYKSLAQFILRTAKKSSDFNERVYRGSGDELCNDYYVRVVDLITYNQSQNYIFWSPSDQAELEEIVNDIKQDNPNEPYEPIVFVPVVEDRNIDSLVHSLSTTLPEAVIAFDYNATTRECPSYTLGESDLLTLSGNNINEDYAWDHPVFVFAQEENVPNISEVATTTSSPQGSRFNGIAEYGGIIQITDIGAVEPWVAGKLELKFFVFDQSGTQTNSITLGKTKRKKFKNSAWVDFNRFLFNWNLSNIGNWNVESWLELDGGNSTTTVSQTIAAPCTGCPSTTISYQKQNRDDELGQSLVQFTDDYSTVYNISYSNFKRKTQ